MQNAQEINQMTEGQKSQTARTASRGLEPRCVPVRKSEPFFAEHATCQHNLIVKNRKYSRFSKTL